MRRIVYAGTVFYTGDSLAAALLEYARALASRGMADAVHVPGRLPNSEAEEIEVLIGPASQLVSEPVHDLGPDIVDVEALAELRSRAERVSALPDHR